MLVFIERMNVGCLNGWCGGYGGFGLFCKG